MIVFEGFKDLWRKGFYTLNTTNGYITFPTKKEAIIYLKDIKAEYRRIDLK